MQNAENESLATATCIFNHKSDDAAGLRKECQGNKARGLCDCVGICLALAGLREFEGRALNSRRKSDVKMVL